MLRLIERCPEYVSGYKDYCQELYNNVVFFRPTNPDSIDENWFFRTKAWYEKRRKA